MEVFLWPHRAFTHIPKPEIVLITTRVSERLPGKFDLGTKLKRVRVFR